MIKKALFLFIFTWSFLFVCSQTGPAGVGTSATNVFWIKADAGTSSTTNNAAISSWNDQSGNAIHVTQTVSSQQPSFATNVINGFPAILFDNTNTTNDKMLGPDSPLLDNTTGYTFFYVTRPMNFGDARVILSKRTTVSVDQSFMLFYYTSNKLTVDIQTTNDRFPSVTAFSSSTNYQGCLIYDGSAPSASRCALYNEETFDRYATETSTLVPDNASPLLIGTTDATDDRPFGGYIAEVMIYREALGAAKRIIVNNYLSAKYNISLSANDKYAGDQPALGNYDREVAGIGREAGISNASFSASVSGGLTMVANSGLDNGDYILAGHAVATNTTITSDVGGMSGTNKARWQRIWYIDVTNTSTNIDANIEFDMSDGGMATFTLGLMSNYVLLYRAGQTGNWTELATPTSITGDRIVFSGFGTLVDGYITLGTRDFHNSPLPVDLISFTAQYSGKQVDLNWSTASEKNNQSFSLERSKDGLAFETFATVKGAGTSNTILNYTHTDKDPYPGTSYYRLTQTDHDGKAKTSGIVAINAGGPGEELLLFPNPNSGNFRIQFPEAEVSQISLTLRDISGREFFSELQLTKDTDGYFSLNAQTELVPGTYIVIAAAGHRQYSQKLIIK